MKFLLLIFISIQSNAAIVNFLTNEQLRSAPLTVSGTFSAEPASGSATSALQEVSNSWLQAMDTKLGSTLSVSGSISSNVVFPSSQSVNVLNTSLPVTQSTNPWITSGSATITNFPLVQQVSQTGVVSVQVTNPTSFVSINGIIPTSATGITPISGNVSATILNNISGFNLETTQSSLNSKIPTGLTVSGTRLLVDVPAGSSSLTNAELRASPVVVSGSVTANVSFPSSQSVNVLNTVPVTGAFFQSVQTVSTTGIIPVSVNNQISGFSTSALQTSGNASLTSIDSKLTSPLVVSGTFFQATQPVSLLSVPAHAVTQGTSPWIVSGVVTTSITFPSSQVVNQGTSPWITSGSTTISNFPSVQTVSTTGTIPILVTNPTTSVSVSNLPATQTVSGNVTVNNQISGFALESTLTNLNSKVPTNLTVSGTRLLVELPASGGGGLTNAELRASAVPVSVTGTLPISGNVTVNNPQTSVSISGTPNVNITNGSLAVTGTFFQSTQPISAVSLPLPVGAALESTQVTMNAKIPSVLVNDRMKVESFPLATNLGVTAVGAANAAVTLTIPAVASQFHYIDSIEITLYSTAARTGNATPITCTTTNLSGNPAYTWATAGAIGTENTKQLNNANRPIKSSVVNTATTIVCPAVTGGLWRMNVRYSTDL